MAMSPVLPRNPMPAAKNPNGVLPVPLIPKAKELVPLAALKLTAAAAPALLLEIAIDEAPFWFSVTVMSPVPVTAATVVVPVSVGLADNTMLPVPVTALLSVTLP